LAIAMILDMSLAAIDVGTSGESERGMGFRLQHLGGDYLTVRI